MTPDPLFKFERLANRAAKEPIQTGDIVDRVIATLESRPVASKSASGAYLIVGAGSLTALAVVATAFWQVLTDLAAVSAVLPFVTVLQ